MTLLAKANGVFVFSLRNSFPKQFKHKGFSMNRNPRIGREFAKQHTKARIAYQERGKAFYKDPEAYEKERVERLEAYKKANGTLPAFQSEKQSDANSLPPLGWDNAVKYTENPTKVEKPYRRTVMKYKPLTV
jgi:hypothetical protein